MCIFGPLFSGHFYFKNITTLLLCYYQAVSIQTIVIMCECLCMSQVSGADLSA